MLSAYRIPPYITEQSDACTKELVQVEFESKALVSYGVNGVKRSMCGGFWFHRFIWLSTGCNNDRPFWCMILIEKTEKRTLGKVLLGQFYIRKRTIFEELK